MDSFIFYLIFIGLLFIAFSFVLSFVPIGLYIAAVSAGVRIGIGDLIGMRLRRVAPARIVNPMIKSTKAGLEVTLNKLEAHYLAGGNVDRVVNALIAAQRADIDLGFERAAAIDLAGRDVLEAVQMSVNPKVIETPIVAAVAKDGIELKAKARVTVRANIDRLVAAPVKRRSLPALVRVLLPPSAAVGATKMYWKTQIKFRRPCSRRGLMREPSLPFFPSISLTSM